MHVDPTYRALMMMFTAQQLQLDNRDVTSLLQLPCKQGFKSICKYVSERCARGALALHVLHAAAYIDWRQGEHGLNDMSIDNTDYSLPAC